MMNLNRSYYCYSLVAALAMAFITSCGSGIPPVDQRPTFAEVSISPDDLGFCEAFTEGLEEMTVTADVDFVDEDDNSIVLGNYANGSIFRMGTNDLFVDGNRRFEINLPSSGIVVITLNITLSCSTCCDRHVDAPNDSCQGFAGRPRYRAVTPVIDVGDPSVSRFIQADLRFVQCGVCGCID